MTLRTAGSRFRSVALIFAFVEPLGAAAQDPDPIDRNPEVVTVDVEVLKAEIQKILDEHRIPGASVALVDKDRTIWAGGIGKADVAADVDVTAEHLFRVASISKSFTALAVLRAVEDGFFDLGSPVRELAPEVGFTNRWEGTHPITVAMLMEHTTGFDDLHFSETAKVDDPEITLAEGLAYHPHSRVSRWQPGTYTSYSNSGPAIAAYVIEKITGQAFEDYVREHVFDPLGMESSTFHVPRDAALMAKGYEADGVSEANYDHTIFRPSGGLSTSSQEMARYLRMRRGRDGHGLLHSSACGRWRHRLWRRHPVPSHASDPEYEAGCRPRLPAAELRAVVRHSVRNHCNQVETGRRRSRFRRGVVDGQRGGRRATGAFRPPRGGRSEKMKAAAISTWTGDNLDTVHERRSMRLVLGVERVAAVRIARDVAG